ncbi:MAG: rhodanese-like domain-containing protein [Desulfobulbaceae bacterium]|nr:rhodanese-like domain-containing protein [Desulfobulbaceae bacterium]
MKTNLKKLLPLAIMLSMLTWGCAQTQTGQDTASKPATEMKQQAPTYTGKIIGKSNKAKTISIEVGKGDQAKTMMVKFDDKTTGLEFAAPGEAAIINWEERGDDKFATVIKPKLASLPEGVSEIKTDELSNLVKSSADIMIIDSRPASRYAQAHLPGAVSIPAEDMKTKAAETLPKEKDKLLVFYCGGPT